ncbi:hypothetical protein ACFYQT_21880 [Streptomyces tibetensis]|uniref:PPM-type phosphatase domain-containing protein n=1 Tax=Streptomyces tibetensis TaxID=2382123 RepID=A0ABW6MYS1_9ACTN
MLTDGVLERNAGSLGLSDLIVPTRALHPREAARTLIAAIVDTNHGHLQDDATVTCLDWPWSRPRNFGLIGSARAAAHSPAADWACPSRVDRPAMGKIRVYERASPARLRARIADAS